MTPEDFQLFAGIVKKRSGLFLSQEKVYLLKSRLMPLARKYSLVSLEDLAKLIRTKPDEKLFDEIAEMMTTNESSFFRDQKPFDQFRQILLPQFLKSRAAKRRLRIWSAASSSGQEAYSLAMICVEEAAKLQGWTIEIVGTDYSHEMVEKARTGIYSQFEVQRGMPVTMLVKYFKQLNTDQWQVNPDIRAMVKFSPGNLLEDFSSMGFFDIVFCRNVLIYFDRPDKTRVLKALHARLPEDGVLFLGGAETVLGLTDQFAPMDNHQGIYLPQKAGATSLGSPKERPLNATMHA